MQNTNTATTGSVVTSKIAPTYNQVTATTANTDLLINRTETAVGSGQQNLIDAQVGGVSRFRVDNAGVIYGSGAGITGVSATTIPFSGLRAASVANTIDNLNFAQVWNNSTATTQSPLSITANALTTGSLLNLTSSSATLNSTSGLLNVANTSAVTTGTVARIQSNSAAGSGMTVLANGNTGLGTSSPVEILQLKANTPLIRFETPNTGGTTIDGFVVGINSINGDAQIWNYEGSPLVIGTSNAEQIRILQNGNIGIGTNSPTAVMQIKAGTIAAGTAPLKFTSGPVLTTPEAGAVEYDGTNLFFTNSTPARRTIATTTDLGSYLPLSGGAMTGAAISSAGTAAAPSVGVGQTSSGLFSGGTNILGFSTAGAERMRVDATGNVGINTSPRSTLDVSGTVLLKPSTVNATATINFLTGNLQHTAADCQAFALHNMKDGGSYTFAVKGAVSATCSFTAFTDAGVTGLTVHMPPDHSSTTASKHTLYSFLVMGADVYVTWLPDL